MDRKSILEVLDALIAIQETSIIKSTFVETFLDKSIVHDNGYHHLHGNFNLGGTVSGRLSSNKPNMQNIPSSGTKFAKPVKKCFVAPNNWIMAGADFSSLEDRISALTTKDPNKLKVYTDGYDGHCLRAYSYFKDEMPDIENTLESINSIASKYPGQRQRSKMPTFALTYAGTWHTLVANEGLSEEEAKNIEAKYHDLYSVSDEWVQDKINKASIDGFVQGAFGLKLRTPILKQVILNHRTTPYEAQAEARTAGNMLGQSYGLLNNRAAIEFQERVLNSKYKYDILPIAHIHDAQYFLIKNNVGCVHWFNKNLVECMQWQELPDIQHDQVKLGGEVEIYYPTWADPISIPNNATKKEILEICKEI